MSRVSIITDDLEHCYICGSPDVEIHHIFGGANRKNSERYGLIVPLCHRHHNEPPAGVHFNENAMLAMHAEGQKAFESMASHDEYMKIFGRDYIAEWEEKTGRVYAGRGSRIDEVLGCGPSKKAWDDDDPRYEL